MTDPDRPIPQRLRDPNVPADSEGTVPYTDPLPTPTDDDVLEAARESSHADARGDRPRTDEERR